jgi:hypothetical protein
MINAAQNVLSVAQAITWNAGKKMADVLKWAAGLGLSKGQTMAFSGTYLRRFTQFQSKI